jgi:hypothetical protein
MNFELLGSPLYIWILPLVAILIISFVTWINIFFSKEHQTQIIIKKVNKYFGFLYAHDFKMKNADYFPEGMGAWTVVLESKECKFLINQDRGGVYCEIAPIWAGKRKYSDLYLIVTQIEKTPENIIRPLTKNRIDSQLEFYAKLFNTYFDQVISFIKNQSRFP